MTNPECSDIANKIRTVAENIPSNNKYSVTHNGYNILVKACALLLERNANKDKTKWEDLYNQTTNIPNLSDRVFTLAQIAEMLLETKKKGLKSIAKIYLEEAQPLAEQIPAIEERLERLKLIAEIFMNHSFRSNAREIWEVIFKTFNNDMKSEQGVVLREIIDTVHRYDPEIASGLISIVDDDPGKSSTKKMLEAHLSKLKTHKEITNCGEATSRVFEEKDAKTCTRLDINSRSLHNS